MNKNEDSGTALDTTPAALGRLLARRPGGLVVIEARANAGWVHDQAVAAGHPVKIRWMSQPP